MKFRLGDRVKVCDDDITFIRHLKGTIGEVVAIDVNSFMKTNMYYVSDGSSTYTYDEDELELIEREDIKTNSIDIETIKTQVWELAKKLASYDCEERVKIFNESDAYHYGWILDNYTPDEVLAKIEEYEKNNLIQVGDILRNPDNSVEYILLDEEYGYAVSTDFKIAATLDLSCWEKTGRSVNISDLVALVYGDNV